MPPHPVAERLGQTVRTRSPCISSRGKTERAGEANAPEIAAEKKTKPRRGRESNAGVRGLGSRRPRRPYAMLCGLELERHARTVRFHRVRALRMFQARPTTRKRNSHWGGTPVTTWRVV